MHNTIEQSNEKQYVIYGASSGGKKVFRTLQSTGIDIDFFVDSNPQKWGNYLEGKPIRKPETLNKKKHLIIIASELNQESIEESLDKLGLSCNIIMKEEILLSHVLNMELSILYDKTVPIHKERQVYIELLEGTPKGFGGMAGWSINIASILQECGTSAHILASAKAPYPKGKEQLFQTFETSYENYWEDVIKLVRYLKGHLPCTLILNKQLQLLYAGILLKKMYPEQVKIISVIHNDALCLYKRSVLIATYIDKFLCTTKFIQKELINRHHLSPEKTVYKEMPISKKFFKHHIYSLPDEPIRLAYAGRLVKNQKRADFLPVLFDLLDEKEIEYQFYIAGSGEYQTELLQYINRKCQKNQITLCGQMQHENMPEFWCDKDIFIALSDKEGTNLSMLEAMAAGAVPVVTAFTSTEQFVTSPKTGFVVQFNNIPGMANIIEMLFNNREEIKRLGQRASTYVQHHCKVDDYKKFILELCEDVKKP